MKRYVKSSEDNSDLQEALDLINEYAEYEFYGQYGDQWKSDNEYETQRITENDDLTDIGLMYTTGDNDEELQVSVDLVNNDMLYYVNNKLVHKDHYNSLADLISKELVRLSWDDMFSKCTDYID